MDVSFENPPVGGITGARAQLRCAVDAKLAENALIQEERIDSIVSTRKQARLEALLRAGAGALARAERSASVEHFSGMAYGEGLRRAVDIYRPRFREQRPLLFFFYGGAWRSGAKEDVAFVGWALARLGFVVAIPDHRLVPEVRFPSFLEDAAQAVAWVQTNASRFGACTDKSLLVGHSAGAHTALMLGLDRYYLDNAGACFEAIRGVVGLSGPYDFYPFPLKLCEDAFGSAEDPRTTQPVHFARPDAPPTLLATGLRDRHVPVENTASMAAALAACGARQSARYYANADHIDPLLSFSRLGRGRAPVVRDLWRFARQVGVVGPYRDMRLVSAARAAAA